MTLHSPLAKLNLTAHITFSAGWLGAIAAFLALAIAGLTGQNPQIVRSMYVGMEVMAWFVIIPFCISALFTGIVQSVTTPWGLFQHYWIVVKLVLTLIATGLLLLHMQPVEYISSITKERMLGADELQSLRIRLIADASLAIFVLLVAIALSVYKPFGRIQFSVGPSRSALRRQTLGFYVILGMIALFIAVVILHLFGISLGHH